MDPARLDTTTARVRIGAALGLCTLLAASSSCARQATPPNVLLIVVDTLRADRMSVYGSERETTPRLAEWAAEGIVFTHAQAPRAKTTPSVTSLLTGLYPHDHGVRDLSGPYTGSARLLSEAFRSSGYDTLGIVGNFVLTRERSGLDRGFGLWVDELPQLLGVPPDHVPQRTAASLTDGALVALGLEPAPAADTGAPGPHRSGVHAERPWFAYLHYMDPHGLYDPPPEHRLWTSAEPDPIPKRMPRDTPETGGGLWKLRVEPHNLTPDARLAESRGESDGVDANVLRDRYDGELHYADAEIGRLLDRLRAAGRLENTIVVLTADHGESLGEHLYYFEHGFYTYEVTCRVPLVIWLPARMREDAPAGQRHGDISLVDLGPTLLELAGQGKLGNGSLISSSSPRGRSRASLVRRDDQRVHPVFSEKVERAEESRTVQAKAVRLGDWKLIQRYTHLDARGGGDRELRVLSQELYDLAADPGETKNLIGSPPTEAPLEFLVRELVRFAEADVHFADLSRALQRERERLEREDPEALRILEALGY